MSLVPPVPSTYAMVWQYPRPLRENAEPHCWVQEERFPRLWEEEPLLFDALAWSVFI